MTLCEENTGEDTDSMVGELDVKSPKAESEEKRVLKNSCISCRVSYRLIRMEEWEKG